LSIFLTGVISIFCPACKVLYYQTEPDFFKDSEIRF